MNARNVYALGTLVTEPLQSLLQPDETIIHVASGRLVSRIGFMTRNWMITITNKRIICTRDERKGRRVVAFDRASVRSAQAHGGLLRSRVLIVTEDERVSVAGLTRTAAHALAAAILRSPEEQARTVASAVALGTMSEDSHHAILDRIDRLEAEVEELREQVRFMEALSGRSAQVPVHHR